MGNRVKKIIVVAGPTASGKSELAVRLAEDVGGEVVNADSMQFYSGMEIGTARPSNDLTTRVPHHLFGIVEPDLNFTAANFVTEARRVIDDILKRGNIPVVTGGTGLYLRALLGGLAPSPPGHEAYRRELIAIADREGNDAIHQLLQQVDMESAGRLHVNDRLRIIRALEVYHQTGIPFSSYQKRHGFGEEWCDALKIGLDVERKVLYERIERRVDDMVASGLVEEVRALLAKGYVPSLKPLGAIGYKEICCHLAGLYPLAEAIELIKRNTRRYAKRQLTWFRPDNEIKWFEYPKSFANISKIVSDYLMTGEAP